MSNITTVNDLAIVLGSQEAAEQAIREARCSPLSIAELTNTYRKLKATAMNAQDLEPMRWALRQSLVDAPRLPSALERWLQTSPAAVRARAYVQGATPVELREIAQIARSLQEPTGKRRTQRRARKRKLRR